MLKRILVLIVVFIYLPHCNAQQISLAFKKFTTEYGLSQNWVLAIEQDLYGFMWFGTSDGLNRFDGYTFEVYNNNPTNNLSLRNNHIQSLEVDKLGRTWIGTMGGLCLFNRDENNFIIRDDWPISLVNGIVSDDKYIYVGTVEDGISIYSLETFESIVNISEQINTVINGSRIESIAIDSLNHLYVGTYNGLYQFDLNNENFTEPELHLKEGIVISSLEVDHENRVWFGTFEEGLYLLENFNDTSLIRFKQNEANPTSISSGNILSLKVDSKNILWIGTENGGLNQLALNDEPFSFKHFQHNDTDENSLNSNSIYSIFEDTRGDMWIGTYGGGINFHNNDGLNFRTFRHQPFNPNSLINNTVNVISKYRQSLFIGTEGGISVLNLNNNRYKHYVNSEDHNSLSSEAVWALYPESSSRVWVGSWAGGVDVLDIKSEKIELYKNKITDETPFLDANIFSIYRDKDGDLWISTMGDGLYFLPHNKDEFQIFQLSDSINSISSNWVRQVVQTNSNNIWISTYSGVDLFNKETGVFTNFSPDSDNANAISGNGAYALYEDSKGNLWLGTQQGLNYFVESDSSFRYYLEEDGLPNNAVKSILEDSKGNLWLGTNKGIVKFSNAIEIPENPNFVQYQSADGLQGNEFNRRAAYKDSDGMMYFGGTNGFNVFHPDSIKVNLKSPKVVLTNLLVMNKPVGINAEDSPLKKHISVTKEIVFNHKQSVITFEFAALNYIVPEKNLYAYKLEGFEDSWNYVGTQRIATYTNLNAGKYTFYVKASNNDRIWNESPLALTITILPPWWKSKVAIFVYMLGFLVSLLGFIRLSQQRYKKKQRLKLERIKSEQQDVLNQQKLQFFTNISHEFRTPLTLISSPLEDILRNKQFQLSAELKKKFAIIYKNANRLNRLIGELMDFRKLQFNKLALRAYNQDVSLFIKSVVGYFEEEAVSNKISLSLDIPDESVFMWYDPKMLEKVLFNLISNAFKVTPEGGAIKIRLNTEPKSIKKEEVGSDTDAFVGIEVKDTGPGLTEGQMEKIFERFYQIDDLNKAYYTSSGIGLSLAKNLTEMHKGLLMVDSIVNKGSTFTVLLKKGKEHFSEDELTTKKDEVVPLKLELPDDSLSEDVVQYLDKNKFSLLLVEDNTQLREYLKNELKIHYKVIEANNGKTGLEQALKHMPDVIISDVIMPEKNGYELCKEIKEDVSISHIPVILLTAKGTIEDQIHGTEVGADAYIVKPFHPRLLKSKILQILKSREELFKRYSSQLNIVLESGSYNTLDQDFLKRVTDYIIENINTSELSVEVVGEKINLSRSQLYRKIKSLTGHSVNEFIRIIRLEQAKKIISTGKYNINEVAYSVGFTSPSYFSKCYREYFGKLPSEK